MTAKQMAAVVGIDYGQGRTKPRVYIRVNPLQPITHAEFTDGVWRPVYEDESGQFVIDEDGAKVCGVWFIQPEECALPAAVLTREPG